MVLNRTTGKCEYRCEQWTSYGVINLLSAFLWFSVIWDIYAYLRKYILKFCESSLLHQTLPEMEKDSFIFIQGSWNGSGNILWILNAKLFFFAVK